MADLNDILQTIAHLSKSYPREWKENNHEIACNFYA
jgi:hypothetical protein